MENQSFQKPSAAFIGASWCTLIIGISAYIIGLWNAAMMLNEKGYYFTVLIFGLFAAVSVQKAVRDQLEGIPVTGIYYGLSWFATILSILLLVIGLWNAELLRSEKGFYAMSYLLSMFAAIAVQKNIRDSKSTTETDNTKGFPKEPPF
ncbi:inner membrane protein YiaA [Niabella terrae]